MNDEIDEQLSAYLDGALSGDHLRAFEARMGVDPKLAARVAELKANDAFIGSAFAPLAAAPFDEATLARLGLGPTVPQAANDNPPWWRGRALPLVGGSLAAGLALVLVLTGRPAAPNDGGLSVALDTTPSGHAAQLADGSAISPRLTVRAADGRWCREYGRGDAEVLACRGKSGWEKIGEAHGQQPSASGGVVLASGDSQAPLDPLYTQIGASDPLDAGAEAKAIAGKWKAN